MAKKTTKSVTKSVTKKTASRRGRPRTRTIEVPDNLPETYRKEYIFKGNTSKLSGIAVRFNPEYHSATIQISDGVSAPSYLAFPVHDSRSVKRVLKDLDNIIDSVTKLRDAVSQVTFKKKPAPFSI